MTAAGLVAEARVVTAVLAPTGKNATAAPIRHLCSELSEAHPANVSAITGTGQLTQPLFPAIVASDRATSAPHVQPARSAGPSPPLTRLALYLQTARLRI